MSQFRNILPLFSHFCLALLLSVLANGVFFFHSHELDNGRIITHAHPLLTEDQEHGHTEEELIYLDLISDTEYLVFDFHFNFQALDLIKLPLDTFVKATDSLSEMEFGFEHRGPPYI